MPAQERSMGQAPYEMFANSIRGFSALSVVGSIMQMVLLLASVLLDHGNLQGLR